MDVQKTNNNQNKSSDPKEPSGIWWQPAIKIFGEVTGWIVVPIIGALYLGRYLDDKQGTGNLYFLSLTGLAFIISCTGIGFVGVHYIKQLENESKKKDKKLNGE